MEINNYVELKKAITLYELVEDTKRRKELLHSIQESINKISGAREKVLVELTHSTYHRYYIIFFSTEDQIKTIEGLIDYSTSRGYLDSDIPWLLIYSSDETIKKILHDADEFTIRLIMKELKSKKFLIKTDLYNYDYHTTPCSIIRKSLKWHNLYKLCKKNLHTTS